MTYLRLQQTTIKLTGSNVILGACEADLVPPLTDILDEHLSFATAFLDKGSSEVLGTMWEIFWKKIDRIVTEIHPFDETLYEALHNCQVKYIKMWQEKDNNDILYDWLSFRMIGMNVS